MGPNSRVGLISKKADPRSLEVAERIARLVRSGGGHPILEEREDAASIDWAETAPVERLTAESDIVIVVGGDGTLLYAARHVPSTTPILGINMGRLGFLTELTGDRLTDSIEAAMAGRMSTKIRRKLRAIVTPDGGGETVYDVLNDAVISKSALARIIDLTVEVDGSFFTNLRADGLILATPTGSTAYNLAAGGPIVEPSVRAMIVTPICPHRLTQRPVVLPTDREVTVRLISLREEVYLTLDGQVGFPFRTGDSVTVTESPEFLTLLTPGRQDYSGVLRRKLSWGES